MKRLDSIAVENFRGITKSVELGEKTLILGPNGQGKSTVMHGANFAVMGYLPGEDKKGVFANASGSSMGATVVGGGHTVERTLTAGKTLSERVDVDGNPGNKNSAEGMVRMAFGGKPPVRDVPGFFAATSSQQRRMVLQMVADAATLKKLTDDETKAREAKNAKTQDRQACDKAVKQLTKSLTERDRPTGNLPHLKTERATLKVEIQAAQKRITEAETCIKNYGKIAGELAKGGDWKAKLEKATEDLTTATSVRDASMKALQEAAKPEAPVQAYAVPDEVVVELERVKRIVEEFRLIDESTALRDEALGRLSKLIPDKIAAAAYHKAVAEWTAIREGLKAASEEIALAERTLKNAAADGERSASLRKTLKDMGKAPEEADTTILQGFQTREKELNGLIEPLQAYQTLAGEIEKAKIEAEKALTEEETAKEALAAAVKAQQEVVESASELLARRSKSILPYGNLRVEDDGKDITISWAKSPTLRVERHTLSGGERALFDGATGHSLDPEAVIWIEAAEVDMWPGTETLLTVLEHLREVKDVQMVVMTCHPMPEVEGWTTITMDEETAA